MNTVDEISVSLQQGKSKAVRELIQKALDEGIDAKIILEDGLLNGMGIIGERFKNSEIYIPDVLMAAKAMSTGSELLKPYLVTSGVMAKGKVILGTVKGDRHDIGKNLVRMMMEGKGLEVIDLGVDVAAEMFVRSAIDNHAQIIACSALLTTTMGEMQKVVKTAKELNVRDKFTVMVGGAPVNDLFRKNIGADIYAPDAASAADAAVEACIRTILP